MRPGKMLLKSPLKRMMDVLPDDILIHIFQFMSGPELEVCLYVSDRWAHLIRSIPCIWRGNSNFKSIGQGPMESLLVRHLELLPCIRYLDISEKKAQIASIMAAITKRKKSNLEMIRLRDPLYFIPHIKTLLKLPHLKELQVVIRALQRREERLNRLEHHFKTLKTPSDFRFMNELRFTWKRLGKKFVLQHSDSQ